MKLRWAEPIATRIGSSLVPGLAAPGGGAEVAITPDGPRGPAERVQPGAIAAAQHANVPIVAVGAQVASAWYLGSWDRMCIPKPFTTIEVTYAPPVEIAAGKEGLRR